MFAVRKTHKGNDVLSWCPLALKVLGTAVLAAAAALGCSSSDSAAESPLTPDSEAATTSGLIADVIAFEVSGGAQNYHFAVTVSSPNTGCEPYADWREVVDDEGLLRFRRVLTHSHVEQQSFARSGPPVVVEADDFV